MDPMTPLTPKSVLPAVFQGVVFFQSGQLSAVTEARLRSGGARKVHYLSCLVTHTVAGAEHDEAEVAESEELLEVPVVTEEWVRLSSRCGEMLPVRWFRVDKGQIFSLVVVRVLGLTRGDVEKVWAMVTSHGGKVVTEGNLVTHQVTGTVGKVAFGEKCWKVTPDWVLDSVSARQRMDEVMYNTEMVQIPGKRPAQQSEVAEPFPTRLFRPMPLFMRSKYYKQTAKSKPSTPPTVISAIIRTNLEESTLAVKETSTLKPQKLVFPLGKVTTSIYQDSNGNSERYLDKGRLGSIEEDINEERRVDNGDESSDACSDLQDMETGLIKLKLTIEEEIGTDNDLEVIFETVVPDVMKKSSSANLETVIDCLTSENMITSNSPKKEIIKSDNGKRMRRKSVRLVSNQALASIESDGEKLSPRPRNQLKGLLNKDVMLKRSTLYDVKKSKGPLDVAKKQPAVGKTKSPGLDHVDKIPAYKEAIKVTLGNKISFSEEVKDLLVQNDDYADSKVKGEKMNRRKSVRLMGKSKPEEEKFNRRRSVRLMSRDE